MIRLTRARQTESLYIYKNQILTTILQRVFAVSRRAVENGNAGRAANEAASVETGTHASLKQGLLASIQTANTNFDGKIPPPAGAHQGSEEPTGA